MQWREGREFGPASLKNTLDDTIRIINLNLDPWVHIFLIFCVTKWELCINHFYHRIEENICSMFELQAKLAAFSVEHSSWKNDWQVNYNYSDLGTLGFASLEQLHTQAHVITARSPLEERGYLTKASVYILLHCVTSSSPNSCVWGMECNDWLRPDRPSPESPSKLQ